MAKKGTVSKKTKKRLINEAFSKKDEPKVESTKKTLKLPSIVTLTKMSFKTVWQNKKLFLTISLIYGILSLILVQGIAGASDTTTLKDSLDEIFKGQFGSVASSLSVFAIMLGSAGNSSSQTAGAYQLFLGLITSLALIWALRQTLAGKKVKAKDSFYKGIYPLIPFILVLIVVALQLIPFIIGSTLYNLVITNGIAIHLIEKIIWGLLFLALATLSFYMLTSSVFGLYIVTLPDMTPMKALRSARDLVKNRRLLIFRKIIGLPVVMLFAAAVVMVPIIMFITPLASWVFFALTMLSLLAIHAYMYTLYRELLNE